MFAVARVAQIVAIEADGGIWWSTQWRNGRHRHRRCCHQQEQVAGVVISSKGRSSSVGGGRGPFDFVSQQEEVTVVVAASSRRRSQVLVPQCEEVAIVIAASSFARGGRGHHCRSQEEAGCQHLFSLKSVFSSEALKQTTRKGSIGAVIVSTKGR